MSSVYSVTAAMGPCDVLLSCQDSKQVRVKILLEVLSGVAG